MAVLRYGTDTSVRLEIAPGDRPVECGRPKGHPLEDLAAAVAAALHDPLDYPPLGQITTPGDRVVLVLDRELPQAAQIPAAVILVLIEGGVDPDGIAVIIPPSWGGLGVNDPCRLVPEPIRKRLTLVTHDPADREVLAYLAASDTGQPILLHRAIHEADLVLPIGCLHDEGVAGYYGIHNPVFPAFSNQGTLRRFRSPGSLNARGNTKEGLIGEVDHVAWLLGINFTIQLLPGGGDSVLHVLAGHSDAVGRRGRELYAAAWSCRAAHRASLVVAAIEGDASHQTWENFGRALDAAAAMVEDGGSIAVCCDLAAGPGPALQRMAGARSRDSVLRRIRKERPADALPAAQLARALDRGPVYLLSRLEPSVVEALDMVHVAAPDELARLVRQHESCVLLSNAPRAIARPD